MIHMGALKASKNQDLLAGETKNAQAKVKNKGKEKKNTDFKPKEKQNPSEGASGSKKTSTKSLTRLSCHIAREGII